MLAVCLSAAYAQQSEKKEYTFRGKVEKVDTKAKTLTRYLAPQGSVSLDGVSLTVVAVDRDRFRVALIPHTVSVTTLGRKGQGASVNVEVDVISKYVERHMAARTPRPTFTIFEEQPKEHAEAPHPAAPKPPPTRSVAHTPPVPPSRSRPAQKSTAKKTPAKRPVPAAKRTAKRPASKPAKRRR